MKYVVCLVFSQMNVCSINLDGGITFYSLICFCTTSIHVFKSPKSSLWLLVRLKKLYLPCGILADIKTPSRAVIVLIDTQVSIHVMGRVKV